MNQYSQNISSDIVTEYKKEEDILLGISQKFQEKPLKNRSDYILYDNIKKELATTMLNSSYTEDIIDTNRYQNQVKELYERIDEKIEIIDAYLTEFALRNEISPGVYNPEMTRALLYVEYTKTYIHQYIQDFKVSVSKVENEDQRDSLYVTYCKIMTILSKDIGQIEEYF